MLWYWYAVNLRSIQTYWYAPVRINFNSRKKELIQAREKRESCAGQSNNGNPLIFQFRWRLISGEMNRENGKEMVVGLLQGDGKNISVRDSALRDTRVTLIRLSTIIRVTTARRNELCDIAVMSPCAFVISVLRS